MLEGIDQPQQVEVKKNDWRVDEGKIKKLDVGSMWKGESQVRERER